MYCDGPKKMRCWRQATPPPPSPLEEGENLRRVPALASNGLVELVSKRRKMLCRESDSRAVSTAKPGGGDLYGARHRYPRLCKY